MKQCERCGHELTGKQERWCSLRCSHLGLKALYKKKNKEGVNSYNRIYRKINKGGYKVKYAFESGKCYFCKSDIGLNQHHIDYEKQLVVDLCDTCHVKFHKLLKLMRGRSVLDHQ